MINKGITSESPYSAIDLMISQKINNTRCITFAYVTRVNGTTTENYLANTINAQPLVSEQINTQYNGKQYQNLPEIYNIPYFLGNTPRVGDYCILLHLDRSITNATIHEQVIKTSDNLELSIPIVHNKSKTHDLGDCVAICGFSNIGYQLNQKSRSLDSQANYYNPSKRIDDLEKRVTELEEYIKNN